MTRRAPLLVLLGLVAAGILWLAFGMPTPVIAPFRAVRAAHRPSDIRLLDRHGEVVHELRTDETGRRLAWTPLQEISPALRRRCALSRVATCIVTVLAPRRGPPRTRRSPAAATALASTPPCW